MSRQSRSQQLARVRSLRSAAAAESAQRRAREAAGLAGNTTQGDRPRVFADLRGSIRPGSSVPNPGVIPNDPESLQRAYGVIDPPKLLEEANEAVGVGEQSQINKKEPLKLRDLRTKFGDRVVNDKYLRYPKEYMDGTQDYIKFDIVKYERDKAGTFDNQSRRTPKGGLSGGPKLNTEILRTITLPVPSQLSDSNSVEYGRGNLNFLAEFGLQTGVDIMDAENFEQVYQKFLNAGEGALNLLGDNANLVKNYFATQAVNAFGANLDLSQLLARSSGTVINPNMEMLFNSPTMRQFKFSFKFTPRFETEGEEVRKIIRSFKYHSSPKGIGQDFLKTPDIFQISYLGERGQRHKFLNRFKLCALTNMSVNYTADGTYATYDNETPVSMIMDLNFQELTPIYAEDYEGDVGGVGY